MPDDLSSLTPEFERALESERLRDRDFYGLTRLPDVKQPAPPDQFLLEAMREVDAMLPHTPPITPKPVELDSHGNPSPARTEPVQTHYSFYDFDGRSIPRVHGRRLHDLLLRPPAHDRDGVRPRAAADQEADRVGRSGMNDTKVKYDAKQVIQYTVG